MPMHDWTRVKAGTYHNFHYRWIAAIMDRLNAGLLPEGYFAMAEQIIGKPETDVVALQTGARRHAVPRRNGAGVALAPPRTRFVMPIPKEQELYAGKANQVTIRHELGQVVAVIEILSPGNKDRKHAFATFTDKAADLLQQKVNLLIVDPFPPGKHDPQGIHGALWEILAEQSFELPADKPLTVASYQVGPIFTAFVEPIAVGDRLPDMPLFLEGDLFVLAPLEETYQTTWDVLPGELRRLVESPDTA